MESIRFTVDQPCLLTLRRHEEFFQVAASNPENKALTVLVRISLKLQGDEVRTEGRPEQSRNRTTQRSAGWQQPGEVLLRRRLIQAHDWQSAVPWRR